MSVASRQRLIEKLSKKAYRDAYAEESIKTSLPFQIKAIREKHDWSQSILGEKAGMKQNAVSRLESAEYEGNLNINTLLRLAAAFDCALLVKFVPFSKLVREFEDVSPSALEVEEFDSDKINLEEWVASEHATLDTNMVGDLGTTSSGISSTGYSAIKRESDVSPSVNFKTPKLNYIVKTVGR